jgi:hypothetical protein
MKRISQITIKRMNEDSPDTSYLGEYSNRAESKYAIDRAHSLDCQSVEANHCQTVEKLERIIQYLNELRTTEGENPDSVYWESLDDAIDILTDMQSEAEECDCSGGDMERNEYRYFNPCHENYKGESEETIRQYCQRDYERMESLNRGDWGYVGIRADAEIIVDGVSQDISSGGLWGIESDSDRAYFAEIDGEQLSELREQLRALGFGTRAIGTAFKNVEHAE